MALGEGRSYNDVMRKVAVNMMEKCGSCLIPKAAWVVASGWGETLKISESVMGREVFCKYVRSLC